jgi:hypothetical protein
MKIDCNNIPQSSINSAQHLAGTAPNARDGQAADASTSTDTYTPSAEWSRLLDLVKNEPEIRPDRISSVMDRIKSGEYFSSFSAAATAQAMINSPD